MAQRVQKCAGGCGRTQDVTVDPKGVPKGPFTFTPPWTCQECRIKEEKRRAQERSQQDLSKASPVKPPDTNFTFTPRPQKVAKPVPPPAAPVETEGAAQEEATPESMATEVATPEQTQPPEAAQA